MSGDTTVQVSGGVGGILAHRETILGLSRAYGDASAHLFETYLALHSILGEVDDGLLLHDHLAAVDHQAQLDAVLALSDAMALVARACDGSEHLGRNLLTAGLGYPWGSDLGDDIFGPSLWDDVTGFVGGVWDLGGEIFDHGIDGPQRYLVGHPGVVDRIVNDGDILLGLAPAVPFVVGFDGYRALAESLDGHGHAIATGTVVAAAAPRSLADLARNLAARDTGPGGSVDVQIITAADGTRHVVVDVTGVDSLVPRPPGADIADLTSCARAIDGRPTAYEQGVFDAMRKAGVRPNDPVMIVGHSLGGMIAVNAARSAVRTGRFRVTHVVTEGAPIGRTVGGLPPRVQVLTIENRHDIVAHLDGRENPDRLNVVTVTGSAGDGRTIAGNHDSRTVYVPLARATDASTDTSVRAFLRTAHGFLSGGSVTTHAYTVVRS